jgi:DNA-binding PadR family transcriptional regulator
MRDENTTHKDLYLDLIRLHILHHACEGDIFGVGMIEELDRHGYKLSPGTLYPLLHSLEERGLLISKEKQEGRRYRRFYKTTPNGRKVLTDAKKMVRELVTELFEPPRHTSSQRAAKSRR